MLNSPTLPACTKTNPRTHCVPACQLRLVPSADQVNAAASGAGAAPQQATVVLGASAALEPAQQEWHPSQPLTQALPGQDAGGGSKPVEITSTMEPSKFAPFDPDVTDPATAALAERPPFDPTLPVPTNGTLLEPYLPSVVTESAAVIDPAAATINPAAAVVDPAAAAADSAVPACSK